MCQFPVGLGEGDKVGVGDAVDVAFGVGVGVAVILGLGVAPLRIPVVIETSTLPELDVLVLTVL